MVIVFNVVTVLIICPILELIYRDSQELFIDRIDLFRVHTGFIVIGR